MKSRIFLGSVAALFLMELAVLLLFLFPETEKLQDTTAVNEALQTVQRDWASLEVHRNCTDLDYVVLDLSGEVLYRTNPGLSESINAAVGHRDTILDIKVENSVAGKLIVYNNSCAVTVHHLRGVFFLCAAHGFKAVPKAQKICRAYCAGQSGHSAENGPAKFVRGIYREL